MTARTPLPTIATAAGAIIAQQSRIDLAGPDKKA